MTSKSDVNGCDWLESTVLQHDFTLSVFALEQLLLRIFIDFQFSLWLHNFNNWVKRLQLRFYFSDVSERVLCCHFFKDPLEALKLNKSSLIGNDFEADVNFLFRFDNQILVLLIFNHIKIFVPIFNEDFKVSNSDVLNEGIVKGK